MAFLGTSGSGEPVSGWRGAGLDCRRAGHAERLLSFYTRLAPVMRAGSFIMQTRTNQRAQGRGVAQRDGVGQGGERGRRWSKEELLCFQLVKALGLLLKNSLRSQAKCCIDTYG